MSEYEDVESAVDSLESAIADRKEIDKIKVLKSELTTFCCTDTNKISKKNTDYILNMFDSVAAIANHLRNKLSKVQGEYDGYRRAHREIEKIHSKIEKLHTVSDNVATLADLTAHAYADVESMNRKVNSLVDIEHAITELSENTEKLNENMNKQQVSMQQQHPMAAKEPAQQPRSFASVIKKQVNIGKNVKLNTFTVKDKGTCTDVKALRSSFLKSVDPIKNKLKIDSIRMVFSKPQLIVKTADPSTSAFLTSRSGATSQFIVEPFILKDPKMIIRNIPKDIPTEVLESAIKQQNFDGFTENEVNSGLKLAFRTGDKQRSTVDWVIDTSPKIRSHLLKKQALYIDYQRCKVDDFFRLRRCFKCQGFGHGSSKCQRTDKCSHCGEDHKIQDCQKLSEKPTCINCKLSKKASHDHKSSDQQCPSRIAAIQREIESIDYTNF
ncbi:uncharacterized protein LOC112539004 [Tetranychus urticae]|uniref:uncharacterized protein LOC112539004 n=1 Tax=Tetranychus urticae TaxID=32264 RepID=UPI000D655084|nr:uncharacterized protein LOC112539004 [Tetranychus urticae]